MWSTGNFSLASRLSDHPRGSSGWEKGKIAKLDRKKGDRLGIPISHPVRGPGEEKAGVRGNIMRVKGAVPALKLLKRFSRAVRARISTRAPTIYI